MSVSSKVLAALAVSAILAVCAALSGNRSNDNALDIYPDDLVTLLNGERRVEARELVVSHMERTLGTPFPFRDLNLDDSDRFEAEVMSGTPSAVIYGARYCPYTADLVRSVARDEWELDGYRVYVVARPEHHYETVENSRRLFVARPPFSNDLQYLLVTPQVFFIDEEGQCIGVRVGNGGTQWIGGHVSSSNGEETK